VLGEVNLFPAEYSEAQVRDLEVIGRENAL
jgi:hypothetical protein